MWVVAARPIVKVGTAGKWFRKNIRVTGTMDAVARAWQDHPKKTEMVEANSPLRRLMLTLHSARVSAQGSEAEPCLEKKEKGFQT